MTNIKNLISRDIININPKDSLKKASKVMKEKNCGFLMVGTTKEPKGVITDRDILIRAIAEEKNANDEIVENCMTKKIDFCKEDASLTDVLTEMKNEKVSRLIVKNSVGEICGVISLGDIIRNFADFPEIFKKFEEKLQ